MFKIGKKYECSLCYKTYPEVTHLKNHIQRIHKDEEELIWKKRAESDLKYTCVDCEKKFLTEKVLEYHTKEHMKYQTLEKYKTFKVGKKYECRLCYKGLNEIGHLKRHIERIHENEGQLIWQKVEESDLKYKCAHCEKKFLTENILRTKFDCT